MSDDTTLQKREDAAPAVVEEPIANPGLPAHVYRPTDVDPKAEKRAERQIAGLFVFSMLCVVGFAVSYFTFDIADNHDTVGPVGASTLALGGTLGLALLAIGVGIIQWARKLMNDHEIVEMRHPGRSSDEDRDKVVADVLQGTEDSGIARRPLIRNTLLGALGLVGITPVLALRDLGPLPGDVLYHTPWTEGMRVAVDVLGTPIRPADMEIGSLVNGQPMSLYEEDEEGEPLYEGVDLQIAKSKGSVILVKMEPGDIIPGKGRDNWAVDGVLCYSKICTHVGCPISLYERTTHHVLCPCHQSTFDLADSAKVVFGPAARPLPQLPLALDDEGYLVAQSDFIEAVGPSFWERDTLPDDGS
jgi:ubiquinol-cytochrome c reductase iron-sulfur subunit